MPDDPPDPVESRAERRSVEFVSQRVHARKLPAFTRRDCYTLISLLGLTLIARCVSDRHWPAVCRSLTRGTMPFGRKRRKSIRAGIRLALAGDDPAGKDVVDRVCREVEANGLELRLQIFRDLIFQDWRPQIRLEGVARLEAALADGAGAILWIARFAFSDTIAKIGLHRTGHPSVHLSQTSHSLSNSRFGRRWLNPLSQRMENRYLAERIVMNDNAPSGALRQLHRVLARNGVVSITVESWGAHAADLPVMGGRLRVATGAPSLAWKTGSPLLPVFVIRDPASGVFRVLIDDPLPIDRAQSKAEAHRSAMTQFASRLAANVAAFPGQWRGWSRLRPWQWMPYVACWSAVA